MKKAFHGFRLEPVELPCENIITASSQGCLSYYNYSKAPYDSSGYWECHQGETNGDIWIDPERGTPYYFSNAS